MPAKINFIEVTAANVGEVGIYCIRDRKSPGYAKKVAWFRSRMNKGLRIYIATDMKGRQLGFIEYTPAEQAWRPLKAQGYLFIHCIAVFAKEVRHGRIGSALLKRCEEDAKAGGKHGICMMTSDGPWIANKSLFEKNGYMIANRRGLFELMCKRLDEKAALPALVDWEKGLGRYAGWHLVYADQCPWHEKSVADIAAVAMDYGIDLKVTKLSGPKEAQRAPSGFGTYALVRDGRLLADHYISRTRFGNIVLEELKRR